jgi:hypothetical protein
MSVPLARDCIRYTVKIGLLGLFALETRTGLSTSGDFASFGDRDSFFNGMEKICS